MSTNVTVQGPRATTATLTYDSSANAMLAQYIANAITAGIDAHPQTIIPSDSAFTGSPPLLPSGSVGEYVQDTAAVGVTTLPVGIDDFIAPTSFNVFDNNPHSGQNVLAGAASGKFIAQQGAGTIITGGGNNDIILKPSDVGSWMIVMGGGNDTVQATGSGNDTIRVGAGNDSIQLGAGNSAVTTGGAATIAGSTGAETVTGSNTDVIYGYASKLLFLATGGATVFGGTGADTVSGGNGPDYFQGGSGGINSLSAGVGSATLFGAHDGDQLIANGSGAQILYAGVGNETLTGSAAGGGNDTFVGGSGNATMAANTADTNLFEFVFQSGSTSQDPVTGLSDVSQAHLHLVGYGANNISDVTSQNAVGGNLVVTLTDGTQVTFQNITAHLTSSNFS